MNRNGTMMQYFEWDLPGGMLWKKLADEAAHLAAHGFTSVWIPPAYKGAQGAADVGYATYDIWDLGEFDQKGTVATKYGTKAELQEAIARLHENGIDVYADVVLDHKMGADALEEVTAHEVSGSDRNQDTGTEKVISAWTNYTFPGRGGTYSPFEWHWQHFDGVDWDARENRNALFLFSGKSWDTDVDTEHGNYDYLMGADIDLSDPDVIAELTRWGEWFVREMDIDGFRFDAVKHMRAGFYRQWIHDLRESIKDELFSVGEYWTPELQSLLAYIDRTDGEFSLFDVPLHFNLHKAATSGGSFDMRTVFDGTLTQVRPDLSVTFVDNHDTQPGQALESFVPAWFKRHAYSLILLREAGYPCVFYGDYYGLAGGAQPSLEEDIDILVKARYENAYGEQHDYLDHPDIIGWTREGAAEMPGSGLAVLLSDGPGGEKKMYVGRQHAGQKMQPLFSDGTEELTVDEEGQAVFSVPGGAAQVWTFAAAEA